jgi:hypothetical protein
LYAFTGAEVDTEKNDKSSASDSEKVISEDKSFLNIKAAHERSNSHALGPKNTSAVGLNPVVFFNDFTLESNFYYGRQFSYSGYYRGAKNWSSVVSDHAEFYKEFDNYKKSLNATSSNGIDKSHFYRTYSRGTYTNNAHDFRVVVGDTTTRNTIGFQQALSGAGVSIFRQSGNGSEINAGSPILITGLSKVECSLNGQIIALQIFKPGIYSINDFPEEAKLPGVTVKISDQLGRSEVLTIDYFSGYGMLAAGKDDFDLTVLCSHRWDLEDPNRLKYRDRPRYSTNYRYGYSDDLTLGIGGQLYESTYTVDGTLIFAGDFGKISPNIAYSRAHRSEKGSRQTGGAGIFYATPENATGIFLETFLAFKGRGFGDLNIGAETEAAHNAFIDKYFSPADVSKFRNSSRDSSSRQIIVRLYSKPIMGVTPAFTFNGEWACSGKSGDERLREYTLSFTTRVFNRCTCVLAGGLTYDDPSKGRNLRSPDRRLTLACSVDLNSELSVQGSYVHYDDELRRVYGCVTYTPEAVKGLELTTEMFRRPGVSNPVFTVKYDTEFFGLKVDESITDTYKDNEAATSDSHSNRQRIYLGTSLSKKGFGAHRKSGFNILK